METGGSIGSDTSILWAIICPSAPKGALCQFGTVPDIPAGRLPVTWNRVPGRSPACQRECRGWSPGTESREGCLGRAFWGKAGRRCEAGDLVQQPGVDGKASDSTGEVQRLGQHFCSWGDVLTHARIPLWLLHSCAHLLYDLFGVSVSHSPSF